MIFFYIFGAGLLISLLLTPLVMGIALRAGIVDIPNQRSLHDLPLPKVGGIAIYFAFILPVIWILGGGYPHLLSLIVGATVVLLVGFIDDMRGLSPLEKILGQALAAAILIKGGIKIALFPVVISMPLTLLWMVGMMNAINLMDGMDGLAAGISAIAGFFFMIFALQRGEMQVALISAALAGASLGFLRFNFHKASIFMGDTGSLFLGFVLGFLGIVITFKSGSPQGLFVPIIILGIPIFDTSLAVGRRIFTKKSLFNADCDHFYEWFWKKRIFEYQGVVALTYLLCLILGAGALFMGGM